MKTKRSVRSIHLDFVPGRRWPPWYHYYRREIWCPDGDERVTALIYEYRLAWFTFTIIFDQAYYGA
jgi:hypothetical protein